MSEAIKVLKELQNTEEPKSFAETFEQNFKKGLSWTSAQISKIYKLSGRTGWVLATTALITLVPLFMEVQREQQVIQIEELQIKDLKAQGYTNSQLAEMGFHEQNTLKI